jgi:hypothetical protein
MDGWRIVSIFPFYRTSHVGLNTLDQRKKAGASLRGSARFFVGSGWVGGVGPECLGQTSMDRVVRRPSLPRWRVSAIILLTTWRPVSPF